MGGKMKKRRYFLLILILIINANTYANTGKEKVNSKVIKSRNMKDNQEKQLDINKVSKEELIAHKITMKIANGILDYREKTGGFTDISELKLVKGVGDSTYKNIHNQFKVTDKPRKKPLNINDTNNEILTYYGFTKKEIKEINQYIKINGRVKNNLDLMEIFSSKKYEEFKDIIIYDDF